ncbi:large proline-rich protein BAG6 isoform X2 [Tachypleus tridentatus]|uniref:large proline-rich protein BAG6 isoform X2 n=1 Tax=Tachypleus tridentatus TaxID=6853 RepID=UPI003FD396B4
MEVTVKTLDSQNHSFSVPEDITVKEFKEKIASSVGTPSDKQRLIFCGRVLQDEKKLSEYDVNGKVIHLVQRPPPLVSPTTTSSTSSNTTTSSSSSSRPNGGQYHNHHHHHRDGGSFLLGAFTIPQDLVDPTDVQQIVQDVVSGMGEIGRNATVMSRTSDDGSSVDVHINLGQVSMQSEAQLRLTQANRMVSQANQALQALESGTNGNGSVNDSPMQTDAEVEQDSRPEGEENRQSDSTVTTDVSTATYTTTNISTAPTLSTPVTSGRLGEGIAQAARAAAAAAMAAAAGAVAAGARAAAGNTVTSTHQSSDGSTTTTTTSASSGGQDPTPGSGQSSGAPVGPQVVRLRRENPRTQALSVLVEEINQLNQRLQPHLQQYQQLLRDDPDLSGNHSEAQQTFNRVSQVLHYMSHAYHAMSDLSVSFAQSVPRTLRVRLMSSAMQPTAVIHSDSPFQAQVNVGIGRPSTTDSQRTTTETATTTSTSSSTTVGIEQNHNPTSTVTTTSSTPTSGIPLLTTQSPVVFMEVGPHAITIDSISAAVVSGPERGTRNTSTTSVNENERDNTHTTTTTSGSTGTRSSPNFGNGGHFRTIPQMAMPFQSGFDPCLPCNSRWAMTRPGTRGARTPRGARNGSQTRVSTGSSSGQTRQGDEHLHQFLGGLMNSVFSQPSFHSRDGPPPTGQASTSQSGFTVFSSGSSPAGPQGFHIYTSGSQGMHVGPPMAQLLEHFYRQIPNTNQTTPTRQTTSDQSIPARTQPQSERTNRRPAGTDDTLTNLVQEVMNQMMGAVSGRNQTTVAEFMLGLDGYSYVPGENLLSDLFMCVARVLTFQDLTLILLGQSESLNRCQTVLREFVQHQILQDQDPTEENIETAVTRLINQFQDILQTSVNEASVRPGIDFVATVNIFARQHLRNAISLIINPPETFGSALYLFCRTALSEFVVLTRECCTDGLTSLERIVQARIREMTGDTNSQVQQWMLNVTATQIGAMSPDTTPESIQRYIVTQASAPPQEIQSQPLVTNNTVAQDILTDLEVEVEGTPENASSEMDVDSTSQTNSPVHMETFSVPMNLQNGSPSRAVAPPSDLTDEVVIGAESWHAAVPTEWVPIITRDVQRQRRQAPCAPFSDAYLSGMPSKRRKMMGKNGHQNLLTPVQTILPNALQRAISAAGVRPLTSLDRITQDATQDERLHAAYREQLKCDIEERLENDLDYNPSRFPNANKYFKEGNK